MGHYTSKYPKAAKIPTKANAMYKTAQTKSALEPEREFSKSFWLSIPSRITPNNHKTDNITLISSNRWCLCGVNTQLVEQCMSKAKGGHKENPQHSTYRRILRIKKKKYKPTRGLEPPTCALRMRCSTSWATSAKNFNLFPHHCEAPLWRKNISAKQHRHKYIQDQRNGSLLYQTIAHM